MQILPPWTVAIVGTTSNLPSRLNTIFSSETLQALHAFSKNLSRSAVRNAMGISNESNKTSTQRRGVNSCNCWRGLVSFVVRPLCQVNANCNLQPLPPNPYKFTNSMPLTKCSFHILLFFLVLQHVSEWQIFLQAFFHKHLGEMAASWSYFSQKLSNFFCLWLQKQNASLRQK